MAKPSRPKDEPKAQDVEKAPEETKAENPTPHVTIVNTGGVVDPEKVKEIMDKLQRDKEEEPAFTAYGPVTPPEPLNHVACVCLDPYGRVVILHKHAEDGQMDFPKGEVRENMPLDAAANEVMRAHSGITAPTWELFAYDAGTRTSYMRAHTRGVYDAVHVCPEAEGTVHVVPLESITDITQSKHKNVIWMTMLAVYGPLMSSLTFTCPVD